MDFSPSLDAERGGASACHRSSLAAQVWFGPGAPRARWVTRTAAPLPPRWTRPWGALFLGVTWRSPRSVWAELALTGLPRSTLRADTPSPPMRPNRPARTPS